MSYEGSMRGSGIYSYTKAMEMSCGSVIQVADGITSDCTFEGEVDVDINDWGTGYWECPECGSDNQEEPKEYEPEYEKDREW